MIKKFVVYLSQFLLGLTFVISGILKCVDPIGTSIKLHDYFAVFGLSWLNDWTLFISWILCISEFVIGLNILMGKNSRLFPYFAGLFLLVFTPVTLYLAIANPINECGCFGDAIVLTNWQTFWKNIFLTAFCILTIVYQEFNYKLSKSDFFSFIFYWECAIAVTLCFIGSKYLPLIDFRPYRPGVNIAEAMQIPSAEEINYVCVYSKDGQFEEFPLDKLPEEGTGWEFVETKEVSKNGKVKDVSNEEPIIKDFFIHNEDSEDITDEFLSFNSYTFLLISPDLNNADEKYIDKIENIYEYSAENSYNFYCVTLKDSLQVDRWRFRTGAEYDFLYSDATILETIIRSNPGIMLLKNGTILWKSSLRTLDVDELTSAKLSEHSYGEIIYDNRKTKVFLLIALMLAPILLYLPLEKIIMTYLNKKSKSN